MASWLIAVLVPPPLAQEIERCRAAWGVRESPPHVTLKARAGLGDDLSWLAAAQGVVQAGPPLEVSVAGPRTFGRSVVYLGTSGDGLRQIHLSLMDALKPAQRFGSEGATFTPHLSLALARRGVDLGQVLAQARTVFGELDRSPFTFTAHSLWIMRKAGPGALYLPCQEIRLKLSSQPD